MLCYKNQASSASLFTVNPWLIKSIGSQSVFFVPLSQRECIKPPGVRREAAVCVVSDGGDMRYANTDLQPWRENTEIWRLERKQRHSGDDGMCLNRMGH